MTVLSFSFSFHNDRWLPFILLHVACRALPTSHRDHGCCPTVRLPAGCITVAAAAATIWFTACEHPHRHMCGWCAVPLLARRTHRLETRVSWTGQRSKVFFNQPCYLDPKDRHHVWGEDRLVPWPVSCGQQHRQKLLRWCWRWHATRHSQLRSTLSADLSTHSSTRATTCRAALQVVFLPRIQLQVNGLQAL